MALAQPVILCVALLTVVMNAQEFNYQLSQPRRIDVMVLASAEGQCPPSEMRKEVHNNTTQNVRRILTGRKEWRSVAFINMTNSSSNCPPGLVLTSYSKRACQPASNSGGCSSTTFNVEGSEYSRVYGRIIGYQVGSTSAFAVFYSATPIIDRQYVEGVSLTHGTHGERQHIWTFAAGIGEGSQGAYGWGYQQCPCDSTSATAPPSFLGNDYFCESGVKSGYQRYNTLYQNPLWDGQGCTSASTCCQFNDPPWFTKELPSPTNNNIEMRVCLGEWGYETILLELIELYVM